MFSCMHPNVCVSYSQIRYGTNEYSSYILSYIHCIRARSPDFYSTRSSQFGFDQATRDLKASR